MPRRNIILKQKQVEELTNALKPYKFVVLINLKNTPTKLIQNIRKELKKKGAFIKVYKLSVIKRAFEKLNIPKAFTEDLNTPVAVLGVNEHPYRINLIFKEQSISVPAKPFQIAERDIVVEEQETDLPPGPSLSQLKMVGLKAVVKKGKIAIAQTKTIVKAGEEIKPEVAQALQILGIKPFKLSARIFKAVGDNVIYTSDVLDLSFDELTSGITREFAYANNLSINANYPTQNNINILLAKAFSQAKNLSVNANIYSKAFIKDVLVKAILEAKALSKFGGEE